MYFRTERISYIPYFCHTPSGDKSRNWDLAQASEQLARTYSDPAARRNKMLAAVRYYFQAGSVGSAAFLLEEVARQLTPPDPKARKMLDLAARIKASNGQMAPAAFLLEEEAKHQQGITALKSLINAAQFMEKLGEPGTAAHIYRKAAFLCRSARAQKKLFLVTAELFEKHGNYRSAAKVLNRLAGLTPPGEERVELRRRIDALIQREIRWKRST
jgi:hypothetical protein